MRVMFAFYRQGFSRIAIWTCLLVMLSVIYCDNAAYGQEVIVNNSVDKTKINKRVLKSIFKMQVLTWPDGTPIKVFVLPGKNSTHISFSKKVLNTLPHNLQRNWDRLVFSGTGESPMIVKSEVEMLKKIANTRGAIGYVEHVVKKKKVKVLRVY